MGIYQLRYLERIPAHAAVTESVELVKRARKTSAAGLVNAVLRKVESRAGRMALARNRALLSRVAARPLGAALRRDAAVEIARAALREPEKVHPRRPYARTSARNRSSRCFASAPGSRSSTSAPPPATRPRRRSNPACARSPATSTTTASPN